MAKASPTQAWLWHRRLSHLNFETINLLSKNDIVNGLPKLKCVKDQLCSSCEMGKAKRSNFKTKTVPSSKGRLHLLHMDLCGSMRVESINGKKYILNGIVKRGNRTLVEVARTMLSASKLPLLLVPLCCVIFNLKSLSTSFDFVLSSEIFKPLSLRSLSSFPSCDLVSWYRHAHHLESLLTISLNNLCLDNLDIFKEDLENQSLRKTLGTCS
ncbi:retrovirus-related pol polyprotein from transposon TNT 1-94 [Tanacetum coccineum]